MEFLLHLLVGVGVAFFASLPLGPVNLAVVQAALNRGRAAAQQVAIGASLSEFMWVFIAVMGTRLIFRTPEIEQQALFWLKLGSIPVLFGLGAYDLTKDIPRPRFHLAEQDEVQKKLRFRTGIMLGLTLNLLNPVLLPFWLGVSSYLQANDILSDQFAPQMVYAVGVGLGTFLVMTVITIISLRRRKNMSYRWKVYISRGIGILFFGFGAYQCFEVLKYFVYQFVDELLRTPFFQLFLAKTPAAGVWLSNVLANCPVPAISSFFPGLC